MWGSAGERAPICGKGDGRRGRREARRGASPGVGSASDEGRTRGETASARHAAGQKRRRRRKTSDGDGEARPRRVDGSLAGSCAAYACLRGSANGGALGPRARIRQGRAGGMLGEASRTPSTFSPGSCPRQTWRSPRWAALRTYNARWMPSSTMCTSAPVVALAQQRQELAYACLRAQCDRSSTSAPGSPPDADQKYARARVKNTSVCKGAARSRPLCEEPRRSGWSASHRTRRRPQRCDGCACARYVAIERRALQEKAIGVDG
ncbi:hypothetical protein OH77DRAFT_676830 [Trametes cingulata]|nr:hypothetical protein OH77DRAFT_676830 [Trametes cingulata]